MNVQESWEKALRYTEIVRPRIQPLLTFEATHLPYVFLAESLVNQGDTVVRKGEVLVEQPSLVLPYNLPIFEGFDFEKRSSLEQDMLSAFLLVRGVRFPSLKYQNKTESLDIHQGRLKNAVDQYSLQLQKEENVSTGLLMGPEDCWQFSVLIFICSQVLRSADGDMRKLLEDFRKRNRK